jgi:phage host-nuclease inhibitor protein Gam
MKAMLSRVSAIEKQLAAEAEEDAAAMERAEAKQRAALAALDESYAQKVAAIKASMKHLKDLVKKYCA